MQSVKTQSGRQIVGQVPSIPQNQTEQQTELFDVTASPASATLKGCQLYSACNSFPSVCVIHLWAAFLEKRSGYSFSKHRTLLMPNIISSWDAINTRHGHDCGSVCCIAICTVVGQLLACFLFNKQSL